MTRDELVIVIRDELLAKLQLAQRRAELEPQWYGFPMNAMHHAVNLRRRGMGKPPVDRQAIRSAEEPALARDDFNEVFALHLAVLVVDV